MVCSAEMVLLHGAAMITLLKRSTTTNMESKPYDTGRLVTKSIVMDFQIPGAGTIGCKGMWVFGLIFIA